MTKKCKYCPAPARVKVTPAAGGPVIDVCTNHARQARKAVQTAKGRDIKQTKVGKQGNPFAKRT